MLHSIPPEALPHAAEIRSIASQALSGSRVNGIVLHGSRASEVHDTSSDIDLICLTDSDRKQQLVANIEGAELDIFAGSRGVLERAIGASGRDNNNFVLQSLATGVVIQDDDGSLAELTERARQMWEAGPALPGADEVRSLEFSLKKLGRTIARLAAKGARSAESMEIARVQMDALFIQFIRAYSRLTGLWSFPLRQILLYPDSRYSALRKFCRDYVEAASLEQRGDIVSQFLASIAIQ